MAFSFSSLVSPKIMLGIVRQKLENELNEHFKIYEPAKVPFVVSEFLTVIDFENPKINFIVEGKTYPLADYKKMMSVVESTVKDKFGDNPLNIVVLSFKKKGKDVELIANVGFTKDGIKQQEKHIL